MTLMREKRIQFAGMQFSVYLGARRYERLRRSLPVRYFIRPTLQLLERIGGRKNGTETASIDGHHAGMAASSPSDERVAATKWYQSIELPDGFVTPGYVDHRHQVQLYGLPQDMRGMRALDVATYDGFWAFEMERRGAQVVAIDIETMADCDYPGRYQNYAREHAGTVQTGDGFRLAHELLQSRVDRRIISVYNLSVREVGTYDFAFVSDVLLHLRDAALALEKVCSVIRPGGHAIVAEPYSPDLDLFTEPLSRFGYAEALGWWQHSPKTLGAMMWAAGFDQIEEVSRFQLKSKAEVPIQKIVFRGRLPSEPALK
jgi:tRNA (mo5U34)-methyltransferase